MMSQTLSTLLSGSGQPLPAIPRPTQPEVTNPPENPVIFPSAPGLEPPAPMPETPAPAGPPDISKEPPSVFPPAKNGGRKKAA